ncbi:DNA adenine methylase [Candidatus Termititenax persephonae]|uniref:Site-specific DNA-methyltransferase (adenine-specific) n=1 Tax=Candidatus Termititenax persephonae TaxID=2218525 RepID=A0A388TF84_9BACT|nr:DNA adenine methylase [Candidatus Termititenax persephonae]
MRLSDKHKLFSPIIKWSGSKRLQAYEIIKYFPKFNNYYEPFIGGGSVCYALTPQKATCGDICKPLIQLWKVIKDDPKKLLVHYTREWERLSTQGYTVYYEIRDRFNSDFNPLDLFFLSRTCVNGLIRFNFEGKFNNSLHYTRKGINPSSLKKLVYLWSSAIQNVVFMADSYINTTKNITSHDFVYLDPPYFNTKGRYYGKIDFNTFFEYLYNLNKKHIKYALSFDGTRGSKNFIFSLPKELYKRHILLSSGNSSFRKVMGKINESVRESLYLNF